MAKKQRPPKTLSLTDQIRQAVRDCGMTQYRLTKECGIDKAALSRFVAGQRGLSLEAIDKLAELLGLTITQRKPKSGTNAQRRA